MRNHRTYIIFHTTRRNLRAGPPIAPRDGTTVAFTPADCHEAIDGPPLSWIHRASHPTTFQNGY